MTIITTRLATEPSHTATINNFTVVDSAGIEVGATVAGLPISAPHNGKTLTVTRIVGNTVYFTPSVQFTLNFTGPFPLTFTNPVVIVDFPTSPIAGDEFLADNGSTYMWTGDRWSSIPAILSGTALPAYDGGYSTSTADTTLDGGLTNIIGAN